MPDSILLRPLGRVSEPSPDAAPRGSLLEAHNVVIREAGVVRYIGEIDNISSGSMSNTAWKISPQFDNGGSPAHLMHGGSNTDPAGNQGVRSTQLAGTEIQYTDVDGVATSIEAFDHGSGLSYYPMYIARDNLYLSDQRGVYKWTDTDASILDPVRDSATGTLGAGVTFSSGGNDWLPDVSHVNYRVVLVFEDSNGVIVRSAPGPRQNKNNTAGAARYLSGMDVAVGIAEYTRTEFRGAEVYRTRTFGNTIALPEQYFLVEEIPAADFSLISSGAYYTKTVAFEDQTSESDLGSSLYTNSGLANIAPPEHLHQAAFRGHEFWADVAEKEFFEPMRTENADSDFEHTLTSGTWSITDTTVTFTGVGSAEVGMMYDGLNGWFPNGTYITTISGNDVTFSQGALIARTTQDVDVQACAYVVHGDGASTRVSLATNFAAFTDQGVGRSLELFDDTGTAYGDDSRFAREMVWSPKHRTARQGASQVWVNQPEDFVGTNFADLNTASGAPTTGGTAAKAALHRARIYWSKHQEPEHTTLANFQDIGNASAIGGGAIVGLGALNSALIIIKQDGVFRLTGDRGNWRVDPLETSGLRFLGGNSTQVLNDAVVTLTNRGLVRITPGGIQSLTDGIINDWFEEDGHDSTAKLPELESYILRNDGYTPATLQAAVDHAHQEYYLLCEGTDSEITDGVAEEVLIYNGKTGSFTTWSPFDKISALGYSRGDTLSPSGPQRPSVAYADDGTVYILDNDPAVATDSGKPIIKFRALSEGDPTHVKLWTDAVWQMVPLGTRANVECSFAASEDEATTSIAVSDDAGTRQIRCWVPRATARSEELVLGITGDQLAIRGVRVSFRSSGRRSPVAND